MGFNSGFKGLSILTELQ